MSPSEHTAPAPQTAPQLPRDTGFFNFFQLQLLLNLVLVTYSVSPISPTNVRHSYSTGSGDTRVVQVLVQAQLHRRWRYQTLKCRCCCGFVSRFSQRASATVRTCTRLYLSCICTLGKECENQPHRRSTTPAPRTTRTRLRSA